MLRAYYTAARTTTQGARSALRTLGVEVPPLRYYRLRIFLCLPGCVPTDIFYARPLLINLGCGVSPNFLPDDPLELPDF